LSYHIDIINNNNNIDKKCVIDIEIDKLHDYYFRHLKQDNLKCKREYYIDNLNL
jgi:hypothetical protein